MTIRGEGGVARLWLTAPALFLILMMAPTGHADAPGEEGIREELYEAVHDAAYQVDHAWDVFHEAALGGLLASPAAQAEIERDLHESRTLLLQLRTALDRGDREKIRTLLIRLHELTTEANNLSLKRKP